jgi:biotin carboxyl carrier protein
VNYRLKIGQDVVTVEAGRLDETRSCRVTAGERSRSVTVKAVSPEQVHLTVDRQCFNLFLSPAEDGTWVWFNGKARFVQDADSVPRRKGRGLHDAPGEVTPPTPATVMRVLVEVGNEVTKGQALVVVSAMKMELTLSAPYAGTVSAVNTQVGAQVSPGEILVEIDRAAEGTDHE